MFLHVDNADSDQTGQMPRLIWVFAQGAQSLCRFCPVTAHVFIVFLALKGNSPGTWLFCVINLTLGKTFFNQIRSSCLIESCSSFWLLHILWLTFRVEYCKWITVMILNFWTDRHGQTLCRPRSHCLPFHLHRLDPLLHGRATLFKF